ncbi:hypothetical protein [Halobacterium yunchengense]|uniref:hypothetical protein n=1 Tax=Halobacterium yunchengense TaxID=3108497 RepID=UPI003009B934
MLRADLRPRPGALTVATVVAVLAWSQADVTGVSRAFTAFATFALAYLVFDATAAAIEWVGQ